MAICRGCRHEFEPWRHLTLVAEFCPRCEDELHHESARQDQWRAEEAAKLAASRKDGLTRKRVKAVLNQIRRGK